MTGSDVMELEEDDAYFITGESDVMKNKVEPVYTNEGVENASNDPLDIGLGQGFNGKDRGDDSGRRKKERGKRKSKLKTKSIKKEPKINKIKDKNGIEVENITSEEDFSDSNFLV